MANSNMKKKDVPRCLQKWYGHRFGYLQKWYGCSFDIVPREDVESFIQDYKRWMRRRFSDFTITFIDGFAELSGFLKMDGKYVYFSIPDVRHWHNEWATNILIRTAKDVWDYHGGTNHYTTIDEFDYDVFDLIMEQKERR